MGSVQRHAVASRTQRYNRLSILEEPASASQQVRASKCEPASKESPPPRTYFHLVREGFCQVELQALQGGTLVTLGLGFELAFLCLQRALQVKFGLLLFLLLSYLACVLGFQPCTDISASLAFFGVIQASN